MQEVLPIKNKYGVSYKLYLDQIKDSLDDLDCILDEYLNELDVQDDRILLSRSAYGILVSNGIEGMKDDAFIIVEQLKRLKENNCVGQKRITNLYQAFLSISEGEKITPETLNKLYLTITDGLLDESDERGMRKAFSLGRVARLGKVYIRDNRFNFEEQMPAEDAELMLRDVLEYIDKQNDNMSPAYNYVIGQLLHFMLVYIHPYYDGNGRTARCLASWFTLNNGQITGELGNRGIEISKSLYYKAIEESIKKQNVNYFLNLMLEFLKIEIKKEYLIKLLQKYTGHNLTPEQYIIVHCILLTRGERSYLYFLKSYQNIIGKKPSKNFYQEVFEPLLDCGIIKRVKDTLRSDNFIFSMPDEIEKFALENGIYERPKHV